LILDWILGHKSMASVATSWL